MQSSSVNCFCCLDKHSTSFVNLATCRHAKCLEILFQVKLDSNIQCCLHCHSVLVTIDQFINQVLSVQDVLQNRCGSEPQRTKYLEKSPTKLTEIHPKSTVKKKGKSMKIDQDMEIINFDSNDRNFDEECNQFEIGNLSSNNIDPIEIGRKIIFGNFKMSHKSDSVNSFNDATDLNTEYENTKGESSNNCIDEIYLKKSNTKISKRLKIKNTMKYEDKKEQGNNKNNSGNKLGLEIKCNLNETKIKNKCVEESNKKVAAVDYTYGGKIRKIVLSEEELQLERVNTSQSQSFQKLPHKCMTCLVGFDHRQYFDEHCEKKHALDSKFICNVCETRFVDKTRLLDHTRKHYKRVECTDCGKRAISRQGIVDHYEDKHGLLRENTFYCNQCNIYCKNHRNYRYHVSKHKDKAECEFCGRNFVSASTLKEHKLTHHAKEKKVYACEKCGTKYRSRNGLAYHTCSREARGIGPVRCACGVVFSNSLTLNTHLRQSKKHTTVGDCQYICDHCQKAFRSKMLLRSHITWVHLKRTRYHCERCANKPFRYKNLLQRHIMTVHDKMELPRDKMCHYCGKGFTSSEVLKGHLLSHSGARPWRCECGTHFTHRAALYTHSRLVHHVNKKK